MVTFGIFKLFIVNQGGSLSRCLGVAVWLLNFSPIWPSGVVG